MKHKQAAEEPANTTSQMSHTPLLGGTIPLRALAAREAEQSTPPAQRGEQEVSSKLPTTMQQTQRYRDATILRSDLALLIDAENVWPQDAREIVTCAQRYGQVNIRRLYGNFAAQQMALWREVAWQHALTPIHHQPARTGKNATDIALVVDAMQLCEEGIRCFVLASSDSDFVPLVRRLRERGCIVVGIGRKETHLSFKQVCTYFEELGCTCAHPSPEKGSSTANSDEGKSWQGGPQEQAASQSLECRLLFAYREASTQTRQEWISLSLLSKYLLSGMGEQEREEREGLVALLESLPVLFAWKLGKGGQPLLRERGQQGGKAASSPKSR